MTPFQSRLFDYIAKHIAAYGESPTYTQIAQGLAISPYSKSLITRGLRALRGEGRVKLQRVGRRLIISLSTTQLLLLGNISAGTPIEALSMPQEMTIDTLFNGEERFALRVKGASMIDEGIFDGDLIICRHTSIAKEGDIVVALIDQTSATLKRLSFKNKPMVTLLPANVDLKPQLYSADRVQIQGVYLGLIRRGNSAWHL